MLSIALTEWNSGRYPTDPGEHDDQPLLPKKLKMDNGYGMQIPVDLSVGLQVEKKLYFGQFPIIRLSGFHDAIGDSVITNAFTVGLLAIDEIEKTWRRLKDVDEAPVKPVLTLTGHYAWSEE